MQQIPIVLIGEKDHGKSTLIGRLLLDTKTIKEEKIKEIKEADKSLGKEFELSHLVDSFREERERKMTFDTTSVFLKGKKRNYFLIDVPGHEQLISQMLTGASRAKVALVVIAVDEGVKKQTIRHLEIARLLGIEKIGVVINKMDKVKYRKEKFEALKEKINQILENLGFFSKEIFFFPISAKNGDNVIKISKRTPWYDGKSLFQFLEEDLKVAQNFENLPLRFLVQDKYFFSKKEIFVGKIESGSLKLGEKILFLPEKERTKILEIKEFEENLKEAKAGQNVGLVFDKKLKIKRGSVGCLFDFPAKVSDFLKGEIFWIKIPKKRELFFECGTKRVKGKILEPKKIYLNQKTFFKAKLKEKIAFDPQSKTILSKIILKEKGEIIAVGNINE